MTCPDKANLVAQYKITTAAYAHAVVELERSVQTSNKAGFDDLIRLTLDARTSSNNARHNLQNHVAEHGC